MRKIDLQIGRERRINVDFPVWRGPSSRKDFLESAMAPATKREKSMWLNYAVF